LDFRAAVKQDVISRFRIAAIGVDLSPDERLDYDDATRRLGKYQRKLVSKYGAPEDSFEAFMAWIHGAMQGEIPGAGKEAGMYWSALQKRHRLLSECQGKIETALALDSVIRQSNGAICFTLTINAANDLAEGWHEVGVKAAALHSAVDREERRVVFDDFRNKKVDVVVAAKVLDEGIDVPDADLAIIFATSASPIQLIQRYGRVLRKSSTGREARIAHLYVKDTMEDPTRGRRREAFSDIFDAADDVEYFVAAEDFDEAARYLATFRGL
jgi:RNA polymerase primary sigma factor